MKLDENGKWHLSKFPILPPMTNNPPENLPAWTVRVAAAANAIVHERVKEAERDRKNGSDPNPAA